MPKPNDLATLIDLTKTTQTLLTHYLSSLTPSSTSNSSPSSNANLPNPLDVAKASTTLLKSHTTTLSLLLLTPPLTPSALITKIGDVSSGVLSNLVAAATIGGVGDEGGLGSLMQAELRACVRRVLGCWGEVLAVVLRLAERRKAAGGVETASSNKKKGKDEGVSEAEKQEILSATGVLWEACDAVLKFCDDGIVGLVVKKAEGWRSVLLDAVEELKEWGEDVETSSDNDDDDEAQGSDFEDDEFRHEDDIFGAANKLGKGDTEVKALLDLSVKKLKMMGMLYQALIKRRLKTFPPSATSTSPSLSPSLSPSPSTPTPTPTPTDGQITDDAQHDPMLQLEKLMKHLRAIPESVDDLASAFYDLEEDEARKTFDKCCAEAKGAAEVVRKSWTGADDEFSVWSAKWVDALDAA